ncbi:DUF6861 domain-containing protein [Pseudomonas sp.]|jgi:hypothetical protein|uniref:DUF6861 domain-containing protein n=1 Tax=Pseudomonas sp. TaxID=306 RepID=UPI002ED7FA8E
MKADLLALVPSWGDIERNLDQKYSELNQSVSDGLQSANDAWDGFTRRISNGACQAYGYAGGRRTDNVRHAMEQSYPILQLDLSRKWASINISQILPVLLQLVQEVVMILGGSVAIGGAVGGAAGSLAFGIGAAPGVVVGSSIGLQIGNLILGALGLWSITGYFSAGIQPCLSSLWEGLSTAWQAEDGLIPEGLDPSGASAATIREKNERAARQLARGQEQLVLLLLVALVTFLTRGQLKGGITSSLESISTRSARLQAEISNKEFANWFAINEQKILSHPELQIKERAPLTKSAGGATPDIEKVFGDATPSTVKPAGDATSNIPKPANDATPNIAKSAEASAPNADKPQPQEKTIESKIDKHSAVSTNLPGRVVGVFDMINDPGPLAELRGSPAGNFGGGRYNAVELSEDVILHRGGDSNGKALGQWFTEEAPTSVTQVRIDTAVKPQWIDPVTGELTGSSPVNTVYAIKIPRRNDSLRGAGREPGGHICRG